MELVYLWVEEYKNIKNQGFNFSPRFECKFKPEYKQKGNNNSLISNLKVQSTLNIIDKENYANSFFTDNINITAIVGKNGTGKSKILKFLYTSINKDENSFAIFSDKEKNLFYLGNNNVPKYIKDSKTHKKIQELSNDNIFTLFDYSLTYDSELYYTNNFIYPKKQVNSIKGAILLSQELIRNQKNILFNYFKLKNNNQLNKFDDFFQPKIINITFDKSLIKYKDKLKKNQKEKLEELEKRVIDKMKYEDFIKTLKEISELLNSEDSYIKKQFKITNPKPFFQDIFKLGITESEIDEQNNLWHKNFKNKNTSSFNNNPIKQIEMYGLIDESTKFEILSLEITKLDEKLIEILLTSFDHNHFEIDLIDKNEKKLSDLSFGEQQLLFILNQLYSLKDEIIEEPNIVLNNFIVLLDEIDIGFHPDWQKKVISYIIDFLKLIPEKNFHLVFTTHSPFILSDLPKENVIFLEKYKKDEDKNQEEGNCKNATKDIELKTFGANIHTLLSNRFFMSDGLMGKFAKSKISEILDFFNDKEKLKTIEEKQIKPIIESIGEDFLRNKLLDLYYKKFTKDKKEKEKLILKNRIDELQKQYDELNK